MQMEEFYPFFLIIFVGVFFSMVFRRMHVPWVVGLILGGLFVGPTVLGLVGPTPAASFIAQIGLMFLMFIAGLEARPSNFKDFQFKLFTLALINGLVPFAIGFGLTLYFGYDIIAALLVGIIFISSSIAIVIPALERTGLIHTRLGQSVIMTSVIQDIGSLILLSIVLQNIDPVTTLPLYIFYPLVFAALIVFRLLIPAVHKLLTLGIDRSKDVFQQDFRVAFLILLGTVIVFEFLGLHSIVAAFFAGFVLSGALKDSGCKLRENIHTVSYGVFIPAFFILVGIETDISILATSEKALILAGALIAGSVLSKFISGWVGARMVGFTGNQSLLFAVSSIPQLSTTLAVAFTALSLGIIDESLLAAMVALSILTVVVSPTLMRLFEKKIHDAV
ncbi:MAG: cation:proton antiporter [Patescibacteria group bacterium UBA2103]